MKKETIKQTDTDTRRGQSKLPVTHGTSHIELCAKLMKRQASSLYDFSLPRCEDVEGVLRTYVGDERRRSGTAPLVTKLTPSKHDHYYPIRLSSSREFSLVK